MKTTNPKLQELIMQLNRRNKEASEWKNNFAIKLVAQINSKEKTK